MKTQTNNSLFTNVEADNAANVNGGSFPDYSDPYFGFSTAPSYFQFINQINRYGAAYHMPYDGWFAYDPYYGLYQIG